MSLRCKLGMHKFHYENQEFMVEFSLPSGLSHLQSSFPSKKEMFTVRICQNCFLKQRNIGGYRIISNKSTNPFGTGPLSWKKCNLSIEEKREKNLKEILK